MVQFVRFLVSGAGGVSLLTLLSLVGCADASIRLAVDAPGPVLLGPGQPIGPGEGGCRPIGEDYTYEIHRGPKFFETGRGNLFGGTCVENAEIYAGRYDGIMVLFPVSNLWIGVEGEVSQIVSAGPSHARSAR